MSNLKAQKRMAAHILKCGLSRVRITALDDAEEALTRQDVRNLIRKGVIKRVQKKGSSRAAARKKLSQKRKGRMKGPGRRKGKKGATTPRKKQWMGSVKTLRSAIRELRDSDRITRTDYRKLYRMVKGGMFRNRKHVMLYAGEHEMLKEAARPAKKTVKKKAKTAKEPKAAKKTKK